MSRRLTLLLLITLMVPGAYAQRWMPLDAGARSMGQSGLALINTPSAIYWNPANIDSQPGPRPTHVQIDGSADLVVEGDVLVHFDQLNDLLDEINLDSIQGRFNQANFTQQDIQDIFRVIDGIATLTEPGSGVVSGFGGAMVAQTNAWAFSYRYAARVSVSAEVNNSVESNLAIADDGLADLNAGLDDFVQQRLDNGVPLNQPETEAGQILSSQLRTISANNGITISAEASDEFAYLGEQALGQQLADPAFSQFMNDILDISGRFSSSANNAVFADNTSGALIKGITLQEIATGRSFQFTDALKNVRFGFSGRLVMGKTYRRSIFYRNLKNGKAFISDVFDTFNEESRTQVNGTIDAGLTYTPFEQLAFGISAQNIIPYDFDFTDDTTFDVSPRLRAGVAVRPAEWLSLTLDGELLENNNSILPGYRSQVLGGGLELRSGLGKFEFALRGGSFVNLALDDQTQVYTFGLEISRGPVSLSTEGHISADDINIEAASDNSNFRDYPRRVGGSVSLGIEFQF